MYYNSRPHASSVIPALLWANIIIFVLSDVMGNDMLTSLLDLNVWDVRQGQLWRLASYMFLHGGILHIFFNMFALWMFGKPLENTIGSARFLQLYFLSGILGGMAWLAVDWNAPQHVLIHLGDTTYPLEMTVTQSGLRNYLAMTPGATIQVLNGCVGASAGVMGVVIGTAMLYPNTPVMLLFLPIPTTLRSLAIGFMLVETLFGIFGVKDNIAHVAHIGGGIAGFLYLWILSFRRPELYPVRDRIKWFWWRITKGYQLRRQLQKPYPPPVRFPGQPGNTDQLPIPSASEIDRLLNKVEQLGSNSLTPIERETLRRYREQLRNRID